MPISAIGWPVCVWGVCVCVCVCVFVLFSHAIPILLNKKCSKVFHNRTVAAINVVATGCYIRAPEAVKLLGRCKVMVVKHGQ